MIFDDAKIGRVKGFLDSEEAVTLYETALEAGKKGPCLEVGSYCGKSAVYLGTACKENDTVLFSIDHHRGSEEQQKGEQYFDPELYDDREQCVDTFRFFRKTLTNFELTDVVVPIVCKSSLAAKTWSTPLSLVFIDGGHSFEAAFNDYNCWARHIRPGGYLVIHDIFPNPEEGGQAPYQVYQYALASGLFKPMGMTKTLGVLKKLACDEMPVSIEETCLHNSPRDFL
ncbi:Methyltransferase domain-containing protein [Desulfocicer vacuolatum DSM 3385]|uniref:Methyltransferase domain-containing protein n=2 Tax=Desulfocicer vacuolatum TaxID=2298 RepID=A0A1W2DFA0_9BACT|nr:class I SAM-dependent methyltransferase [Desulfocicer vacuolatum]SMC96153.1 Methyltransferase domain-containing protein [Desulfocicer vacuolatum DSM 3385]